eukprot:GEMP01061965.1.p1 GENE.GEMP01061965.1~~GEMP01061965.1.p1  ORF type:complete len:107 (+),score=20.37 GEMP01061965.1:129-449(+)
MDYMYAILSLCNPEKPRERLIDHFKWTYPRKPLSNDPLEIIEWHKRRNLQWHWNSALPVTSKAATTRRESMTFVDTYSFNRIPFEKKGPSASSSSRDSDIASSFAL